MENTIISLKKVKKHYGSNKVLDGINLEVKKGEIFGVIGPSGGGKTTLLNTIIGYLRPDGGSVLFRKEDGFVDVFSYPAYFKRRYGFAAQHPSFYLKLSVAENLDYFGSMYNLSDEAIKTNTATLLELVDLSHARNILAKNLSGGMQRRLDIACSLIHNPEVLFLDEPSADLDPVLVKHIWDLIKKVNKAGTTIVVASHDLGEIETLCDRLALIYKGSLIHVGTVDELKDTMKKGQEVHLETYPGDYDKIMKKLKDPSITGHETRGNFLVIHTKKPEEVLRKSLKIIPKLKEDLLDVRITKLQLKDVFTNIVKEK